MSLKILNEGFSKYFKSLNEEKCEEKDKKCKEKCTDESCDKKDVKKKNLKESEASQNISEYQKWVDYDMKKYKRISDETMNKIKKAGFSVVKDQYGDYEVIADRPIKESKKSLKEAPVYDLSPRFDSRKSFYNKAKVDTGKGDENKLYSYNTLVAEIKNGKPVVYGTYSQTTLRHIKDWLKQNGFKAESSKQIMSDYGVKNESLKGKKNKKLKESLNNSKYKDIIGEYFDYSGDFEFLDIVADLIDRVDFDGEDVDEEIYSAIDEGLIYNADQWKVMQHYQTASEANLDSAIEELTQDLIGISYEIIDSKNK